MPWALPKPCRKPGCPALTRNAYCDIHQRERTQLLERARPSAARRGYDRRWQKASKAFLAAHPLCQCPDCDEGRKRTRAATVVDHHIPHRGDPVLFWDQENWRAYAKDCHDRKTAREDGRWGYGGSNL